eukprot:1801014-Pyramimonas_sp.AAC.1
MRTGGVFDLGVRARQEVCVGGVVVLCRRQSSGRPARFRMRTRCATPDSERCRMALASAISAKQARMVHGHHLLRGNIEGRAGTRILSDRLSTAL